LMASAGLGWEISFVLRSLTLPGYGEAAMAWAPHLLVPCSELGDG
jgi:hypothetical protein